MWLEKGNLQPRHFSSFADFRQNIRLKSTSCRIWAVSLWIVRLYFEVLCTSQKGPPPNASCQSEMRDKFTVNMKFRLITRGWCCSSLHYCYFSSFPIDFRKNVWLEAGKQKCCSRVNKLCWHGSMWFCRMLICYCRSIVVSSASQFLWPCRKVSAVFLNNDKKYCEMTIFIKQC